MRNRGPAFALVAVALASCGGAGGTSGALAPVAALPAPVPPSWISSVSPIARATTLSQIRVIFRKPVAAVGALEGAGPTSVLSHLRIDPALKGGFVVFTPHMVGFVAEQALPTGTRVRVTLTKGLRDLAGDTLRRDLAWTFETTPLSFSNLPSVHAPYAYAPTPPPSALRPTLTVTANARVDAASLSAHAFLEGGGQRVPLDATLQAQPTPMPGAGAQAAFDPSLDDWTYDLVPRSDLQKATTYRLAIVAGVAPAFGNVPTQAAFGGEIRTYAPLQVVPTPTPSAGTFGARFAAGDPAIAFDNPLDPSTLAANVGISGVAGHPSNPFSISDDTPNVVDVDPYLLAPDTKYTIALGAGLKDVFGQTLGRTRNVVVSTSNLAPLLWAPSGINVFPSAYDLALDIDARNLPNNSYREIARPLTPASLVAGDDPYGLLRPEAQWPSHAIAGARTNVQSTIHLPLRTILHGDFGAVAYGIGATLGPQNVISQLGLVSLTNLGVFVQTFPSSAFVRVERLSDGAPVEGADISIYRTGRGASTTPCARATTGATGTANIEGAPLQACYAGGEDYAGDAPPIMAVARDGSDWAYARVEAWSGTQNITSAADWMGGAPLSLGTVFSDRQMYQPGESARLTGVAYAVRGDALAPMSDAPFSVTLTDPDGKNRALGSVRTDAYGVFTLPLALTANQRLGDYSIEAKGPDGTEVDGGLRVAQFKPPNFKLDVAVDRQTALAGSSVTASAHGSYLFGAPLAGAAASVTATRAAATIAPPGWDDYTFGRQWFWPDQEPEFDTDVLQTTGTFDRTGAFSTQIPVEAALPLPMTYSVDVAATDVSNLSVDTTQTFTALCSDGVIGLDADFIATAGKPMGVRVIVTKLDGTPIAGRSVHLDLQSMRYTSATQLVSGGETPQNGVIYTTVGSADATSATAPVSVALTPTQAGPYRIRANFAGGGACSETDLQTFVSGPGSTNWGNQNPTTVTVTLDKKHYRIGETARALVASPFPKSDIYFAVVRQSVLTSRIVHASGNAPTVSFRVTPSMLPNAAVEAFVVRRGANIASPETAQLDSLSRIGFAPLHVDLAEQYLSVSVAPQHARVSPGGQESVTLRVRDHGGHPAAGEAVVVVADDAILQLTGYRLPDLVQTIFADEPISTRYRDNRESVLLRAALAAHAAEKGYGYGGGFLPGSGSNRVRENFNPLAYYGIVRTNGSGEATIRVHLPDELTTWRVMAVALARGGMRFGDGDATFIATKTLLTNPLLPQFARPGDTIDAGLSALDVAGAGTLDVSGVLTGALRFADGSQRLSRSESLGSGLAAFLFPMSVGEPARTSVLFSSRVGSATDAFRVPLPIVSRAVTESTAEAGSTKSSARVPIDLRAGGTVKIVLANSAVQQLALPAGEIMAADPEPFLDDAASRLVIASATAALQRRYHLHPSFDPRAAQIAARSAILALQQDDGGFALFASSASDPFETANAAQAIGFAGDRGLSFNPHATANLKAYLARTLENPGRYRWCENGSCRARLRFEILLAFDALGDRRSDFLPEIVAAGSGFDFATKARLATYLLSMPGYHAAGLALAGTLEQNLYRTAETATASASDAWGWLGTPVQAQAAMLDLLVAQRADTTEIDGAVRALVSQQCGCGWGTLVGTAAAVRALSAYAQSEHLSPMGASVWAGNRRLASAHFGSTSGSLRIALSAASIHAAALSFRASGGTLHYSLLYTYPVASDAPGVLAGLRVIRTVTPVGGGSPLATMDLAPLGTPSSLDAGSVVDIGVEVIVDHPVDRLEIEDPLPAGLQAVDATLRTSSTAQVAQADSWEIEDQQIYADRVTAYADHLEPGIYEMHYLARVVTPGSYRWPGARAYLRDYPQVFGRTAFATLSVR